MPPRRQPRLAAPSTASSGPETTHSAGALTAASDSSRAEQRQRASASRQRHGQHRAGRQRLHQPAARRDQRAARPRARRRRPGRRPTYSPMLWPSSAAGWTPQAHPQPGQGVLDGEQRRLGERGLARAAAPRPRPLPRLGGQSTSRRSSPSAEQQRRSSASTLGAERPARARRARAPCRRTGAPWPGNRKATGAAAGVAALGAPPGRAASRGPPRVRVRPRDTSHAPGGARRPRGRPAACRRRRPGRGSGCAAQVLGQVVGGRARARRRVRADSSSSCQARAAARAASARGGRLLEHDVGVGAADAEAS